MHAYFVSSQEEDIDVTLIVDSTVSWSQNTSHQQRTDQLRVIQTASTIVLHLAHVSFKQITEQIVRVVDAPIGSAFLDNFF